MEFILFGVCIAAGGAALFFWRQSGVRRGDSARLQSELQNELARREAAESARDDLQSKNERAQVDKAAAEERAKEAETLRADNRQLRERAAKAEERAQAAQKQAEEKIALLTEMRDKMSAEFKNLSQDILDEKRKQLGEDSKKILEPLTQGLKDFRSRVEDLHNEQTKERALLKTSTERISRDANNLALALKGDSKTQGDWGEVSLAALLEKSGLREGEEYKAQAAVRGEDGKHQRPDVVIYLPDNKHLIVDSKVSLRDYHDYVAADDADSQKRALARHVKAVKEHVAGLSAKHYASASGINAPDLVFMFMPVEPAFFAALKESPPLFSEAYDKSIALCAPTTLMAILRTVERLWRAERQNKNAMEIARQGANLYDKFRAFLESMAEIDRALAGARRAYDKAQKQLSEGGGNLVGRVEKLRELGVKPKKLLSRAQSSAAEDPDEKEE